jgi:hypothetical protein
MIRPDRSVMQTPLPVDQPSDDEELYGLPPDPDNDPPDGAEAGLAWVPTPLFEDQLQDGRSSLAWLPRTRDALARGCIDYPKALVIIDELTGWTTRKRRPSRPRSLMPPPGRRPASYAPR